VGFGSAHPPPIEGISRKLLNRRSLSGVEWERHWNSWNSLKSMGGGVLPIGNAARTAPLTHPDQESLKETIKQAFPERSRMGAPLKSWNSLKPMGVGYCLSATLRERLRSPTPIKGIPTKPRNGCSLSGAEGNTIGVN
jgi:hypothetical protein